MTELNSHDFEARYEAPADRRSVRIRPLVVATDEETGESPPKGYYSSTRRNSRDDKSMAAQVEAPDLRYTGRARAVFAFLLDTNPSIDLEETDDEIVVLAELPGLDAKDFAIETEAVG